MAPVTAVVTGRAKVAAASGAATRAASSAVVPVARATTKAAMLTRPAAAAGPGRFRSRCSTGWALSVLPTALKTYQGAAECRGDGGSSAQRSLEALDLVH